MSRPTSGPPRLRTAVSETERRLGPIDILVVNHGIGSAHERLVWEQTPRSGAKRCASTSTVRSSSRGSRSGECANAASADSCSRARPPVRRRKNPAAAYTASKHGVIGWRAGRPGCRIFRRYIQRRAARLVRTAMAEHSARAEAERRGVTVEQVWEERAAIYPQKRYWSRAKSRR